jgi:hypothetical protein
VTRSLWISTASKGILGPDKSPSNLPASSAETSGVSLGRRMDTLTSVEPRMLPFADEHFVTSVRPRRCGPLLRKRGKTANLTWPIGSGAPEFSRHK